ncbi:MAG: LysR family transcriptional regulator [Nitrospiraceae bacterium]|nr:LysR family transcriptional regulator [Nitrospiraceae bacterium]
MDFYQLSYFVKVAGTRSISRAAEELLLTQPAVSKQIRALEEELGAKLFDRIGKKVLLTRAGENLYERAGQILRSVRDAETAVRDMSGDCSGELVVGTSDHIGLHRLPDVLKKYISLFPKVDLKLRCHRSETILDMVQTNRVDLGVITLPGVTAGMIRRVIWRDPMSLVFPKDHPLGQMGAIRLRDAASCSMILPESGTATRIMINAAFARKNLSPNVSMEVAYIETIKVLVKVGLGISILPDRAVDEEVKSGVLIRTPLQDAQLSRDLGVLHLKDKFLSRPAIEFLKLLETYRP